MAAPLVYEGGVRGGGGTLFKDMVFWVAHQVPMRTRWVQDIENNGGTIVKLDKKAEYLIADHARKNAPAGAYSWKWIEDSVKTGELLDAEKYAINPPGRESRPVGSLGQKATRTPFTAEDDLILASFVTRYERAGEPTAGNVIYKQLEEKHPHHTYQSWRDRWVKKVQFQPRPKDLSPLPADSPGPSAQPLSRPGAHSQTPQAPEATPSPIPKKTRAKFDEDEDRRIMDYVAECEQNGQKVQGLKIYKAFAEEFPSHTWQSWRDRYLKTLRPNIEQMSEKPDSPEPTRLRSGANDTPKRTQMNTRDLSTGQDTVFSTVPTEFAISPPPIVSAPDTEVQQQGRDRSKLQEIRDSEVNKEQHSAPSSANLEPEEHDGDAVPAVAETSTRKNSGGSHQEQEESSSYSTPLLDPQDLVHNEGAFYTFLGEFFESETQVDTPALWPTICGRTLNLWELWKAVMSLKLEPAERDWQQISEILGYNWIQEPNVPDQVRLCYEKTLSAFEAALMSYGLDEEDGEDREATDNPRLEPLLSLSDGPFNSSPPKQPSLKRSYDSALQSSHVYPDVARKRSRVDRDGEIPSTPDTKNGTSHLRHPVSAGVSPSDNRLFALPMSSRSSHKKRRARQIETEDEGMQSHAVLANPRKEAMEPETQVQREGLEEVDQEEVTPSQQLHSEIIAEVRRQRLSDQGTPTPKRHAEAPFPVDDQDEGDVIATIPKPRYGKGPNPLLSHPELLHAKRRVLPATIAKSPAEARPSSPAVSHWSDRRSSSRQARPPASARVASSPAPQPQTEAERLGEIVEYWMSLGYSREVARRSLEATTWEPSLAGRIMQMLKNGESMPTNWEGVWSPRDDESLVLMDSAEPPTGDKEARKRARAEARLMNKHGKERMALRRRWLTTKAEL